MEDKEMKELVGLVFLLLLLLTVVRGFDVFDNIGENGLKNVVTCVWEGSSSEACNDPKPETETDDEG
jgi:hypothetical protein